MGATFTRIKNWVAETLTYSDLNAEFNNILNNLDPDGLDDASVNEAAMQTVADPYPGAEASLPTSLRGELQRLRYLIRQLTGETYWYIDPDATVAALNTSVESINTSLAALMVGIKTHLSGLELSNSTDTEHDISVATGTAMDSSGTYLMSLTSAMVKRIDAAWEAGTAGGGLFSGSVGASTWYHVFLIRKTSDGTIDAGFDTSLTAANIPTGYVAYRRIGSVLTDASSNIKGFNQHNDTFRFSVVVQNYGTWPSDTNAVTQAVTVPSGIKVEAILNFTFTYSSGAQGYILITSLEEIDTTPSTAAMDAVVNSDGVWDSFQKRIWTNTSSQIRWRATSTTCGVYVTTQGWNDPRGKI